MVFRVRGALYRQGKSRGKGTGRLDLVEAAALPLVTITGNQSISVAGGIQSGQTVLVPEHLAVSAVLPYTLRKTSERE